MTAAEVVRRHRRLAGLSQRALARAAGMGQAYVSRVESGRVDPSVRSLARLVRATGHELTLGTETAPDPHDLSLLTTLAGLTPAQRVQRLVRQHAVARQLRAAVADARSDRAG